MISPGIPVPSNEGLGLWLLIPHDQIGDPNRGSSITIEQILQLDYNIEYVYSFRYKIDADPSGQCAQGYSPQIRTSVGNRLLASGQQDTFDALNNQVTSAAVGS